MNIKETISNTLEKNGGVLRLAPAWVPRSFCRPGRRLKLHPDDYYALGLERGGIDERWFASTTKADNGPGTPEDEGLSYIVLDRAGKDKVLLVDAVAELKGELIGQTLWEKYKSWPIYSKFFDNLGPLPHHIHHQNEHAALTGQVGKPEMYFFPSQMNNHPGEFAHTFFGLNPHTTKEQVKESLENFTKGDNHITELSRAYRLKVDTGWDVPPGVLHAPGSLCTYEPQVASDVFAMYQSVLFGDHAVPPNLLWKNTPENRIGDIDLLIDVIDWDVNVNPNFHRDHFMEPTPVEDGEKMSIAGYFEEWICYKNPLVSAKRLTVYPGQTVKIKDGAAYGFILLQGYGKIQNQLLETPVMIRFGQLTNDEYFVSAQVANEGVVITNQSESEPLVMLKHFAENPDLSL